MSIMNNAFKNFFPTLKAAAETPQMRDMLFLGMGGMGVVVMFASRPSFDSIDTSSPYARRYYKSIRAKNLEEEAAKADGAHH